MRLTIRVEGRPAPQGSKDLGSAGQLLEQSPYLAAWRQAVKVAAYRAYREAGIPFTSLPVFGAGVPVVIERCSFLVDTSPLVPPDIDKLLRSTLDALGGMKRGSARLFADDAQVVLIESLGKVRANDQVLPRGAIIIVRDGE